MAIFKPNLTSKLLLKAAIDCLGDGCGRILELGCGSGFISWELLKAGNNLKPDMYMSDVSTEAVNSARLRFDQRIPERNIRVGKCFEPWVGERFDLIVSDVSGIANSIAQISPWYQGIDFEAGDDGLLNTLEVLATAKNHLNPAGILIFPILSLSNSAKLRAEITKFFPSWSETPETRWPLPQELSQRADILEEAQASGHISFEFKYGKVLACTSIALCKT